MTTRTRTEGPAQAPRPASADTNQQTQSHPTSGPIGQGVQLTLPSSADVRRSDPLTSRQAAERATSGGRTRTLVLAVHRSAPDGLTDDELAVRLPGEHPGSLAKRRLDLVEADVLADSGRTRPTRRGCEAIVWVLR